MFYVYVLQSLKDKSYYMNILKTLSRGRKFLYEHISKLGLTFVDSVTNFILIDLKKDSYEVAQDLLRKGVIVRDMSFWGLDTYIRVTIGTPAENRKFVHALKEVL